MNLHRAASTSWSSHYRGSLDVTSVSAAPFHNRIVASNIRDPTVNDN